MQTKYGGNAWNSKNKSAGDDQQRAFGNWPQLRNQVPTKCKAVESWPKLGGSHGRKNDGGSQKLDSIHPGVSSDGHYLSIAFPKPSVIHKERQEFSGKSQSNECKNSPTNLKTMVEVSTSNSIQASEKPSSENCENVTLSNKEEKILAFKKLQKERKEERKVEKQRKKEDDILRKILGPKGLKVTVIDNNVFSKFCDHDDDRGRSRPTVFNANEVQGLDSTAFPELRRSGKRGVKHNASHQTRNRVPVLDNDETDFKTEENVDGTLDTKSPRSTKSRKRRDPVVVDIWKAIEICKAGRKLEEEQEQEGVCIPRPKEKETCRVAGNILDASNPARHRGKKRETPKRHMGTRLKRSIMAERRRRCEGRSCGSKSVTVGNIANNDVKLISFSDVTTKYEPDRNGLCNPVDVTPGDKLLGNANQSKDVENGVQIEKCILKSCSNATNAVDVYKMTKDSLHSRSFREYCNHSKSSDICENVKLLLKDILKFQDRMHATQPIKAESHRRYVVGLRQTQNLLAAHKVKIVILAPDIEKVPSPGGLDDLVNSIMDSANKQSIPIVFPLSRRNLGKVTYRKVGVSCVGVLNYQGSEEHFKMLISALEVSKKEYEEKFEKEKFRIMNELGILPAEKEDYEGAISQEQVQPNPVKCAVTLTLFQKLTEAISELSIGSTSQKDVKEELCDL